jgi:hypothetical protein
MDEWPSARRGEAKIAWVRQICTSDRHRVVLHLMPPLSLTAASFQSHALLARSLVPRSEPKRHILGSLINTISSLTAIADIMRHINSAVHWIHKNHTVNTEKAQRELDEEYWASNAEEFEERKSHAYHQALVTVAKKKPFLLMKFILHQPEGSMVRLKYSELLKEFNPEAYRSLLQVLEDASSDETDVTGQGNVVESTNFEDIEISDLNDEVGEEYSE